MAPHGDDMAGMDGMGGMDGMNTTSDGMTMMMSIFQNSLSTPLYSQQWTPTSTGTYAATCIFLIVLGAIMRGLLAAKAVQESRWLDRELDRRYVRVQGKQGLGAQMSGETVAGGGNKKMMVLSENGVEEDVMVVAKRRGVVRPWRLSVDPVRAVIDTVIAGVGYLLMLAVMTMNVGYFLAVLGGVFLGSLLVGRYTVNNDH